MEHMQQILKLNMYLNSLTTPNLKKLLLIGMWQPVKKIRAL